MQKKSNLSNKDIKKREKKIVHICSGCIRKDGFSRKDCRCIQKE